MCRRKAAASVTVDDAEERTLDAERYADLPPESGDVAATNDQEHGGESEDAAASATPTKQFGAVHFSFGGQQAPQRATPPEIVAFANGWLTELPQGSALPQTFKQHQVSNLPCRGPRRGSALGKRF